MQKPIQPLSGRILSRLTQAIAREPDPWMQDDLKIAKLTALYAANGEAVECSPSVLASYYVLGIHPDKVWPRILQRREAMGPLEVIGAAPKKPPQTVKLWPENTNAARAVNSRRASLVLHEPSTNDPMASVSIAALYPNSDTQSSAKKRGFTYAESLAIVRHSYVRASVRRATLNALTARGPWPESDGPATGVICVAFNAMVLGDNYGDGICCRRTAQRRAKLACKLGYWKLQYGFNRWLNCPKCGTERSTATCPNESCKYRGRSRNRDGSTNTKEYCRPYTFEINLEAFRTAEPPKYIREFCARTWREHKEASKRGERPNVTEMPRKTAQAVPESATQAPTPIRQPAAEHAHRETTRPRQVQAEEKPKLSKTECEKFLAHVAQLKLGRTRHVEQVGGYGYELQPSDPRYRAPMSEAEAVETVCKAWRREPEVVKHALKFFGYKIGAPESGEERGAE